MITTRVLGAQSRKGEKRTTLEQVLSDNIYAGYQSVLIHPTHQMCYIRALKQLL